jgi:hypothetical protein
MREMADPRGPFGKWHPARAHQSELAGFMRDLAEVVSYSRLVAFCSLVRMQDLERFNAEYGLRLNPYSLAAYGCMIAVLREYEGFTAELVFDHVEKVDSKLARARKYAETDSYYAGAFEKCVTLPLVKGITFRELPAMQAADFLAWEFRRNHENISEWFDFMDRPEGSEARAEHFDRWSLKKFGSESPPARKSLAALVEGNQIVPVIWDYDRLCEAHRLREGKWAS